MTKAENSTNKDSMKPTKSAVFKPEQFSAEVKLMLLGKSSNPNMAALGRGIVSLCYLVEETGSLNKAAKEMRMAYSKAWSVIKHTEEAFGFKLLERKGNKGSALTPEAKRIVKIYDELQRHLEKEAAKKLKELLSE